MEELYFGSVVRTVATLLTIFLGIYMGCFLANHSKIKRWGLPTAGLFAIGFLLCCLAAVRDDYHLSVQNAMGLTGRSGLFATTGLVSAVACLLGGGLFLLLLAGVCGKKTGWEEKSVLLLLRCGGAEAPLCRSLQNDCTGIWPLKG